MGRLGEVAFLLALFVLLRNVHRTRAQYDHYDYEVQAQALGYGTDEDEDVEEEDNLEEDVEASGDAQGVNEGGEPPAADPQNQKLTPMCNSENCWIRVDWQSPPNNTWMSCLLGYRVGFRPPGEEWTWLDVEGTHRDLRSDKLFFFEEAKGTNHSLTIRNLAHKTYYEVFIEVFNPYGQKHFPPLPPRRVLTPPEPCRDASVPEPEKLVASSENSLSVHLDGWQDANCPTVDFKVEQRIFSETEAVSLFMSDLDNEMRHLGQSCNASLVEQDFWCPMVER